MMSKRNLIAAAGIALLVASLPSQALPGPPPPIPVPVVKSSAPDARIKILNEAKPGAEVDIEKHLVRNQINVVVFFADW